MRERLLRQTLAPALLAMAACLYALPTAAHEVADIDDEAEVFRSGFFFEPELVYMQFRDSDSDYAVDQSTGQVHEIDSDYELGWRAGLGWRWDNGFDFVVRATSVENEQSESTSGDFAKGSTAAAFVNVDYDVLDLEFGKVHGTPGGSWMRWFGGARGAWIDQQAFVSYGAGGATLDRVELDAVGLRGGVMGHFAFGSGWGVFLQGSAGILAGEFDVAHDDIGGSIDLADDFDRTVSVLEAAAGFTWSHELESGFGIGVRFGYEFAEWGDVLTPGGITSANSEDFSADGAFLGMRFFF